MIPSSNDEANNSNNNIDCNEIAAATNLAIKKSAVKFFWEAPRIYETLESARKSPLVKVENPNIYVNFAIDGYYWVFCRH